MRTLLVLGAVALLFTSCNNVESFRGPIESLATNWDNTTAMVTEFVGTLQSTQQNLQNQFAQMTVPAELTLSEESSQKVAELQAGYQEQLTGLTNMSQTVSTYVSDWQTKGNTLTELKDGLAAGSLGTETLETVKGLETSVEEAKSSLEEWRGDLEEVKGNTTGIYEEFTALIASLQGN